MLKSGEGGIILQGCVYVLGDILISIFVLFCGNFLESPVRFHVIVVLPAGRGRHIGAVVMQMEVATGLVGLSHADHATS